MFFNDDNRIAGDRLDGIYRSYGTVPAHSPPGIWRLSSITMSDGVGNTVIIDGDVLAQAGFPATFEQVGAGDAEAPRVTSLSVTPDRIDTSRGAAEVRISARILDAGTGVGYASTGFTNPNTNVGGILTRVAGDEYDGVYEGTVAVPRHAHRGWWAAGVQVRDGAGKLGFGTDFGSVGFTQTGPGDETPPRILSVSAAPAAVDASDGDSSVTVTVHATDDLSGLATRDAPDRLYSVSFWSPSQQSVDGPLRFVSGHARDAVYEATLTLPRYSEQGTWTLAHVGVGDNALNWTRGQFQSPVTFEVIRTQSRP